MESGCERPAPPPSASTTAEDAEKNGTKYEGPEEGEGGVRGKDQEFKDNNRLMMIIDSGAQHFNCLSFQAHCG